MTARALEGVRVLDLSRILAGPSAAQQLGDLGADVVKIERPGAGDDTRGWGPPFLPLADPAAPREAAYYLAANRNKRSVAVDLASEAGVELVRALAAKADVLLENYKLGDLARRGLDYDALRGACPRLVYCSISGFGRTGPRAGEPGYDFVAQAMAGTMSITGEPDGLPVKVGVGIADLYCGMVATVAILAALRHRDRTGEGQHLDVSLFDSTLSWLSTAALDHFVTGAPPKRMGNAHPHIVPYEAFATADGHLVLAVGNDAQFARLCEVAGQPEIARDPRYATNAARVERRAEVVGLVRGWMRARTTEAWTAALAAAGIAAGPVRDIPGAFAEPQAVARRMRVRVPAARAAAGAMDLIGSPIKASRTPGRIDRPPPALDEHRAEVLRDWLGLDPAAAAVLAARGAFGR